MNNNSVCILNEVISKENIFSGFLNQLHDDLTAYRRLDIVSKSNYSDDYYTSYKKIESSIFKLIKVARSGVVKFDYEPFPGEWLKQGNDPAWLDDNIAYYNENSHILEKDAEVYLAEIEKNMKSLISKL